jgi:hypothetical protein
MEKKFNRTATTEIIRLLKEELRQYRDDVHSACSKDIEEKIAKTKNELTMVNGVIAEAGLSSTWDRVKVVLLKERERLEKDLETWRQQFKNESESIRFSKEMIRHLEHAIATLKKEFAQ